MHHRKLLSMVVLSMLILPMAAISSTSTSCSDAQNTLSAYLKNSQSCLTNLTNDCWEKDYKNYSSQLKTYENEESEACEFSGGGHGPVVKSSS